MLQYTQAGWDVKKMDDVLDGDWSVKSQRTDTEIYAGIPDDSAELPF